MTAAAFVVAIRRATSPRAPLRACTVRRGRRSRRRRSRHNVARCKRVVGETALCAVVKANGYGHGAPSSPRRRPSSAGPTSLAVAIIDEGIELRERGVTAPILLLAEVPPRHHRATRWRHDLTLTIGSLDGARAAVAARRGLGGRHRVHVKVDTGMHRMGVAPERRRRASSTCSSRRARIDLEGIYTHFSVADGSSARRPGVHPGPDRALRRGRRRASPLRGVRPRVVHAANSAGALGYPEARCRWCASGSRSTGTCPRRGSRRPSRRAAMHLEPALTLRASVVAVRRVDAGERPSYGRRRALERAADHRHGALRLRRRLPAPALRRRRRGPHQRHALPARPGMVTMDQLVVDCGDDDVAAGDEVVLLGRQGDEVDHRRRVGRARRHHLLGDPLRHRRPRAARPRGLR